MTPVAMVSLDPDLLDVIEAMAGYRFIGILDPDDRCARLGVPHLGDDRAWEQVRSRHPGVKAVLAVDPTALRARLAEQYEITNLLTLIAPQAYVSRHATIGLGCIVQNGAKVSRYVRLGRACKLNVDAVAHHDAEVGDFCTLAPGSRLLGSVKLGSRVYVGAGALVLPGRVIGDDVMIGAGAVVTKDVAPATTVKGVPARVK
jgi:sugar O-acyltransferase (sialic acid O-acetyltransferase NeuD family)